MSKTFLRSAVWFLWVVCGTLFPTSLTSAQVRQAWVARYNGSGNDCDCACALAVDNQGNIYVTGWSRRSGTDRDYATVKYDANGNQLWSKLYNGPGNGWDVATALAVDNLGNVYVTGYSDGLGTGRDYATVKYDPNGSQLWSRRYDGSGGNSEVAFALAVDHRGNVYVTGYSDGLGTGRDYATVKYDTNGNLLWVSRYNGPGNHYDVAFALAVDNQGNVYVTGISYGSGTGRDYATVKYDANGNQLWVARYDGPGKSDDGATALAVDSQGDVYVTGQSGGSGTGYDYATVKYDANGNQLWVARYDGPGKGDDIAYALAVDPQNHVYVTGSSLGSGTGRDYATVKYDANGNQVWVARYNGPGNQHDGATALAVDSQGNVYVTGGCGSDYLTIKYDAGGNQLWAIHYNGPGNGEDKAPALVVDNLGNVYVTGRSTGLGTNNDYTTVKYTQPTQTK